MDNRLGLRTDKPITKFLKAIQARQKIPDMIKNPFNNGYIKFYPHNFYILSLGESIYVLKPLLYILSIMLVGVVYFVGYANWAAYLIFSLIMLLMFIYSKYFSYIMLRIGLFRNGYKNVKVTMLSNAQIIDALLWHR
jgi:hypothetical protein